MSENALSDHFPHFHTFTLLISEKGLAESRKFLDHLLMLVLFLFSFSPFFKYLYHSHVEGGSAEIEVDPVEYGAATLLVTQSSISTAPCTH